MNILFMERILNRYRSDRLFYHTEEHILRMLEGFDFFRDEFPRDIQRIGEAVILFHDIVYVPGAKNNEEKSAEIARQELLSCGWPANYVNAVYDIILTTEPFSKYTPIFEGFSDIRERQLNYLIDVIHDLDWTGFRDLEILKENSEKIFLEYRITGCSDEELLKGQYSFYKELLAQIEKDGHLYRTDIFSDESTEESVKENLRKMIELKGESLPKAEDTPDTFF